MELLTVGIARAVWFVDLLEVNPRGLSWTPILPLIQQRYSFREPPESKDASIREIQLKQGTFQASDHRIEITLTIHADGLTADSRSSTEDSDAFLHDLLCWLSQDFGFSYSPTLIKRRAYYSELIVRNECPLDRISSGFEDFCKTLSDVSSDGRTMRFELSGVQFVADAPRGSFRPSFRFERKADSEFSEHRYWTQAHLSTQDHLTLLDEFATTFLN